MGGKKKTEQVWGKNPKRRGVKKVRKIGGRERSGPLHSRSERGFEKKISREFKKRNN